MALRIKSTWRTESPKSIKENAEALAYIAWRLAMDKAINLHGKDYVYDSDGQRMAVIAEYLAFQVQVADRLAYDRMDEEQRRDFINALGLRLAAHVQDNLSDLFGPGDYAESFIVRLNERMDEYAAFEFKDDKPGYAFYRYLGERIQVIMGGKDLNRWVIDQVMELDAPEVVKNLRNSMDDLLG